MLVLVTAINVPNLCLYQKVHNLPEISSYAAGLLQNFQNYYGSDYHWYKRQISQFKSQQKLESARTFITIGMTSPLALLFGSRDFREGSFLSGVSNIVLESWYV